MDISTFAGITLSEPLLKSLHELGYTQPTPIQQQAIELIMSGKDVVGQAQTGSGKTAAYGLPILHQIDTSRNEVQALIIVPTRELALQVREELKKYGKYMDNLKITTVYGGHSFSEEQKSFTHPPQVLIATPGRLLDHLQRETFQADGIQKMVTDEADKLLEMGFEEELNEVISLLPAKRQNLLFSATLPEKVLTLIRRILNRPQYVITDAHANPVEIEFIAYRVAPEEKIEALLLLLLESVNKRTVIFCNTRERVEEVASLLRTKGFPAEGLHGAMEQRDRDKAMMKFRNGSAQLLVATDLAARGIHIEDLGTVIHLEILRDESSFLHRSGRTGRAGQTGKVHVLLAEDEIGYTKKWKQLTDFKWGKLKSQPRRINNSSPTTATPNYITLHFMAGKKEKLSPRDIVGALIAETGLEAAQIGKIEIHDHFSYVAVPFQEGKTIVEKLNQAKIKGKKIRVSIVR